MVTKSHFKVVLQWGVIGGVSMAILRMIIYFIAPLAISSWENVFYLPLLFCMVWGAVTVKRNQNGNIDFSRAFLVTFLIALISSIFNSIAAVALIKWIDPQLGETLLATVMEQTEKKWESAGLTDEQIEQSRWWVELFFRTPVMFAAAIVWQSIVGGIISVIISVFVKRTNPDSVSPLRETPLS